MMSPIRLTALAVAASLALCGSATAAEGNKPDKPQAEKIVPPPPPEALTQGKQVEPKVKIFKRQWATFEEFSVHGQVYAVKVTPVVGPPYYLYDSDGDGSLESRHNVLRDVPQTQQWKILTW